MVNGASGIAVGMATNIPPPHNLGEIIDGLLSLIEQPNISLQKLMELVKGPDFPTAGEILGRKGIIEAYQTGRGSIVMRSKAFVESIEKSGRERIIVSEIPFQVNKAKLIEKIADLVRSKKIDSIADIRDESAKEEIRIVIDVKRGESGEVLLNNLFKMTPMQCNFGVNLVALVKGSPKILTLKEMLEEFYLHRREVVLRKTSHSLRKAQERQHLLVGLKQAVENSDHVVELIRKAADTQTAQNELERLFELSSIQAKAILDMRLARLTSLEREKIVKEHQQVTETIADLTEILKSSDKVTELIVRELKEVKEAFADDRKTLIIDSESDGFSMENLIADEEVGVTVTHSGYVKRTALSEISAQKRGGKGRSGILMKEEDFVQNVFTATNHQSLLCFTNLGKVYELKVYDLPEEGLRNRGKHFANLINLASEERVVSVLPVAQFEQDKYVYSVTKAGMIKKTDLMAYSHVRSNGIIGLKLDAEDTMVSCAIGSKGQDIILATRLGKAIRFSGDEMRSLGRASKGVTGIRFSDESDYVIGMEIGPPEDESLTILSVCENGYGKRTPLEAYRRQSRGGKGIYTIKVSDRNGPVIGICQVRDGDDLMIMTSSGKLTRFKASDLGVIGRFTQGVRVMDISAAERVIALSRVPVGSVQS